MTPLQPLLPSWQCLIEVAPDHPAFDGHFVGAPVLPGVMLLAWVIEAAADSADLGTLAQLKQVNQVNQVKFLRPVRPGDQLHLLLTPRDQGADFVVCCGDTQVAKGRLGTVPTSAATLP